LFWLFWLGWFANISRLILNRVSWLDIDKIALVMPLGY